MPEMKIGIERKSLVGMAAGLCLLAACSGSTGTGGNVKVRETPATPESTAAADASTAATAPGAAGAPGAAAGAAGSAQAAGGDAQLAAATTVGQQWLGVVDQGQYAESWSAAGKLFQANMQQQRWVQTLTGARQPLGNVISREVAGSEIRTSLPGAPAGTYAIVSYATNFQNKQDIIENVTMVLEEDGQWRVVGYSASPRATTDQQGQPGQTGQGQPGQGQTSPQPTSPQPSSTPTPSETPPLA